MNLELIKQLAKKIGGVLIFNKDRPELVVLTYEKFKDLESRHDDNYLGSMMAGDSENAGISGTNGLGDQSEIKRLNQEVLALKEEIRQREATELTSVESEDQNPESFVDLQY